MHIYSILCQGNRVYVGESEDPDARYLEHKNGTEHASEFCKKYKPIRPLDVFIKTTPYDETNLTKDYMKKYGIDNVRGGPYTQLELPENFKISLKQELHSESNECYGCGQSDHFAKECPQRSNTYQCYGCQETGHFIRDCPNKVEELVLKKKIQNQEDLPDMNPKMKKILKTRKILKTMKLKMMKKRKRILNMDLRIMMMKQKNLRMNLKKMKMTIK